MSDTTMRVCRHIVLSAMVAAASASPSGAAPPPAGESIRRMPPATFADVAARVSPSVVGVSVLAYYPFHFSREELGESAFLERLDQWARQHENFEIGEDGFYTPRSGSGVIIDDAGHVLTSWHLLAGISERDRLRIALSDGRIFDHNEVELVGHDEMTDLAVLKVKSVKLTPINWGASKGARPGDWVIVLGNPLDFAFSVSQGIISGTNRQVGSDVEIEDLIQTTAMINPGSSGGAMVDLDGRLLGIVMAMATRGDSWQGLGFAIPEHIARPVAAGIIADGFVKRGYLGIQMERITRFGAKRRGLPERDGVRITGLIPGFPAENSALSVDDIIVEINGQKIRDEGDVYREIATRRAGDRVRLTALAVGGAHTVEVALAERPAPDQIVAHLDRMKSSDILRDGEFVAPTRDLLEDEAGAGPYSDLRRYGITAAPWLGGGNGVVVLRVLPGSLGDKAGLKPGDVVLRVDGEPVGRITLLSERLAAAEGTAALEIDRGGGLVRLKLRAAP